MVVQEACTWHLGSRERGKAGTLRSDGAGTPPNCPPPRPAPRHPKGCAPDPAAAEAARAAGNAAFAAGRFAEAVGAYSQAGWGPQAGRGPWRGGGHGP
jgi:hypothetical protein